ncbi:hypothetical protein ANCDUO_20022, partial [Ancylostoma duodenale]
NTKGITHEPVVTVIGTGAQTNDVPLKTMMAIEFWWKQFEESGFGDKPMYTDMIANGGLKYAANILHDETTKVGCAVNTCDKQGVLVIDCRYDG